MRQTAYEIPAQEDAALGRLDLVIPWTDECLTRAAIRAAERIGRGLSASLRILRLETVPFPADLRCPPVSPVFLCGCLAALESHLPLRTELVLTRDPHADLICRLSAHSVVVIATRRRFWQTAEQRLARRIREAGFNAVVVFEEKH